MARDLTGPMTLVAAWAPLSAEWPRLAVYLLLVTLGFAAVVALQGRLWRRKRAQAWPDHLEYLHEEFKPWWLLRFVGVLVGLAVLWTGVVEMGRGVILVSGLATGASLLVLVHRRWNTLLAYLGLALMTLVVCAALAGLGGLFVAGSGWDRPLQWGCVLSGLAVMTFMWLWLGRFWDQQLHRGRAWTTTGRMIVPARRMGIAVAVLALCVAARLAVWPNWPQGPAEDAAESGGWLGGVGIALLALVLLNRARSARSTWLGGFSVLAVVIGGAFCWLRW